MTHGKLLLAPARWNVSAEELKMFREADSADARFHVVQTWRAKRDLPPWIVVADHDNRLPVHLDSPLAVEAFTHLVKRRDTASVEELWPEPVRLCATGPEGRYVHEIVVPDSSTRTAKPWSSYSACSKKETWARTSAGAWRSSIDTLLGDLGLDLAAKHAVIGGVRRGFGAEMREDVALRRALGARFRKDAGRLSALLDSMRASESALAPGIDVYRQRSTRFAPIMAELQGLARDGRVTRLLSDLAAGYVHMHVNRLMRSAHRRQELVLYDLLAALYRSLVARSGVTTAQGRQRIEAQAQLLVVSIRVLGEA